MLRQHQASLFGPRGVLLGHDVPDAADDGIAIWGRRPPRRSWDECLGAGACGLFDRTCRQTWRHTWRHHVWKVEAEQVVAGIPELASGPGEPVGVAAPWSTCQISGSLGEGRAHQGGHPALDAHEQPCEQVAQVAGAAALPLAALHARADVGHEPRAGVGGDQAHTVQVPAKRSSVKGRAAGADGQHLAVRTQVRPLAGPRGSLRGRSTQVVAQRSR